jgi:hypothetical protein
VRLEIYFSFGIIFQLGYTSLKGVNGIGIDIEIEGFVEFVEFIGFMARPSLCFFYYI